MSENLTHCRARGKSCPRCDSRPAPELIAEVNRAISDGIRRSGSAGQLIAYNWAWEPEWTEEIVRRMGTGIPVMAVSETGIETNCFGYHSQVLDYSISKPGPGQLAKTVWRAAGKNGTPCVAKVQINASWELSAVPYIPVPDLVERHFANLKREGVSDLMLSWTLGGCPGGNLGLLCCSQTELARTLFGEKAAVRVLRAWALFSEAFAQFPINRISTLYFAPQNFGPSALLFGESSGRSATMIGFPYDDIDTWRGAAGNPASSYTDHPMPEEILFRAFEELSLRWRDGMEELQATDEPDDADQRANLAELRTVAEACFCHFRSAAMQTAFVRSRNAGEPTGTFIAEERELAIRLLAAMRRDSRIGFEASNHYFYTEQDLLEKVLNCDYLMKRQLLNQEKK